MTVQSTPATRTYRFSILRTLFCGLLLSVLVAACLYVHHTAFTFYHARLLENNMKTTAWIVEQVGFVLPWIVICLFQYMVYHKHDRRDGAARREMMWEIAIVAFVIYAVLLPYISHLSDAMKEAALNAGAVIPETDVDVPWTLMMKMHEWFVRLLIPLSVLFLFHRVRATREIRHPETTVREIPVTVDDYYGRNLLDGAGETTDTAEETATGSSEPDTAPMEEATHA